MVYKYTKPLCDIAAMYNSPGPCYPLPNLVGQQNHDPRSVHNRGPAYPFGVRHGKFKDECSPGPCYNPMPRVSRHGLEGSPKYSMYERQKDKQMFKTPGPGAYMPEHCGPTAKMSAPKYSFGTRHKHRKSDNTPGPNAYSLPHMVGKTVQSSKAQAPCYSLTGRSKIGSFSEDLQKAPGPGTYNTTDPSINQHKSPHYSMTSRNVMPGDTTQKPGPGAHSPETVWEHKIRRPAFTFGIRHTQYEAPLIIDVQD